jgi:hypothetical protein
MNEYGSACGVTRARSLTRAGGERQHMGNVALALFSDERQRNTGSTDCRIARGGHKKSVL